LALSLVNCPSAIAQTTNAVPTVPSFFTTVQSYFTSQNAAFTNCFGGSKRFDVWTGAEYLDGLNVDASLGLEYKAWSFGTNSPTSLSMESVTKNAGIAGTILAQQAGVGFNYVLVDTKLTAYVDGGYSFLNKESYAEIGIRAKKALTPNTYLGLGLSLDISAHNTSKRPNIVIFTGFTF
jgi:hypothetical protein